MEEGFIELEKSDGVVACDWQFWTVEWRWGII